MNDLEEIYSNKQIFYCSGYTHDNGPCQGARNVSIFVQNKRVTNFKCGRKLKKLICFSKIPSSQSQVPVHECQTQISAHSSVPVLSERLNAFILKPRSLTMISRNKWVNLNTKYIVNIVSESKFNKRPVNKAYPYQSKLKVYRCELNTNEGKCCCPCYSEAIFEVIKCIYECYKNRNNRCACKLCRSCIRGDRKLGEMRKLLTYVAKNNITCTDRDRISSHAIRDNHSETSHKKITTKLSDPCVCSNHSFHKSKASESSLNKRSKKKHYHSLANDTEYDKLDPNQPQADVNTLFVCRQHRRKQKNLGEMQHSLDIQYDKKTKTSKIHVDSIKMKEEEIEGETMKQKEKRKKSHGKGGISYPEGQPLNRKKKVKSEVRMLTGASPKRLNEIKQTNYVTFKGKPLDEKSKILKGLIVRGLPMPEGLSNSDKELVKDIQTELGKTSTLTSRHKMKSVKKKVSNVTSSQLRLIKKANKKKKQIMVGYQNTQEPTREKRHLSRKKHRIKYDEDTPSKVYIQNKKYRKYPQEHKKGHSALEEHFDTESDDNFHTDLSLPAKTKTDPRKKRYATNSDAQLKYPVERHTRYHKENVKEVSDLKQLSSPDEETSSEKIVIADVKNQVIKTADVVPSVGEINVDKENTQISDSESRISVENLMDYETRPNAVVEILANLDNMKWTNACAFTINLEKQNTIEREKHLLTLAKQCLLLPEGNTNSEKKLVKKVCAALGIPTNKKSLSVNKYTRILNKNISQAIEKKTRLKKQKILQCLDTLGVSLPEGRTISNISIVARINTLPPTTPVSLEKSNPPGFSLQKSKISSTKNPFVNIRKKLRLASSNLDPAPSPTATPAVPKILNDTTSKLVENTVLPEETKPKHDLPQTVTDRKKKVKSPKHAITDKKTVVDKNFTIFSNECKCNNIRQTVSKQNKSNVSENNMRYTIARAIGAYGPHTTRFRKFDQIAVNTCINNLMPHKLNQTKRSISDSKCFLSKIILSKIKPSNSYTNQHSLFSSLKPWNGVKHCHGSSMLLKILTDVRRDSKGSLNDGVLASNVSSSPSLLLVQCRSCTTFSTISRDFLNSLCEVSFLNSANVSSNYLCYRI